MQSLLKPGRLYYVGNYANAKNDISPLLLVFRNDNYKYIEGINVNYLSGSDMRRLAQALVKINVNFRNVTITGVMMYNILMSEIPDIIEHSYRKYFLAYISNVFLVSNGATEPDSGGFGEKIRNYGHPFVVYLNKLLKPDNLNAIAKKQEEISNKIASKM